MHLREQRVRRGQSRLDPHASQTMTVIALTACSIGSANSGLLRWPIRPIFTVRNCSPRFCCWRPALVLALFGGGSDPSVSPASASPAPADCPLSLRDRFDWPEASLSDRRCGAAEALAAIAPSPPVLGRSRGCPRAANSDNTSSSALLHSSFISCRRRRLADFFQKQGRLCGL